MRDDRPRCECGEPKRFRAGWFYCSQCEKSRRPHDEREDDR